MTDTALVSARPADVTGRAQPFHVLLCKECIEQILSARFVFGLLMCVVLCSLSSFLRSQEYARAHAEKVEYDERWLPAVEEQVQRDEPIQVEGIRELSALSVMSVGLESLTPVRFTCTKEGLRFGEGRGSKTPTDALYGQLDLSFVVGTLLSLLAVMLTFDSVTRERDQGTLAMLLSYPVRRPLLLAAKIVAAEVSLALCLAPSLLLSVSICTAMGVPTMALWRWMALAVASLLYLLIFVALGVMISASVKQSGPAAVIAVFAWALPVFAAPRIISLVVSEVHPATRENRIALKEEALISQAKVAYAGAQTEAFRAFLAAGDDSQARAQLNTAMKKAAADLRARRMIIENRLWDETEREQEQRAAMLELLSYASPTAVFDSAVAELSGTGALQRHAFYRSAHDYYEAFGAPMAESRHIVYGRVPGMTTDRALVMKIDIRPYLTQYVMPWVPSSAIAVAVVAPVIAIASFSALLYVFACAALIRADVRRQ